MRSAARARPPNGGSARFIGVALSIFAVACGGARLLFPTGAVAWATTILGTAACVLLFILLVAVRQRTLPLTSSAPVAPESADILRNLLEYSPDYIFIKDRQLRTILCNPLFASSTGRRPEDLYGKTDIENGANPEFVKGNPEKGIRGFEQDDLDAKPRDLRLRASRQGRRSR